MRMKKLLWLGLCLVVAIGIGPVLVAQFTKPAPRKFSGVRLEETRFESVMFRNAGADLDLGGMLFVPEGKGTFPAVAIIHGSGCSRRNNRWYLTLAQFLQQNGIAVLLPDKRGCEHSAGNWRNASFEDLASDTIAAISFLRTQDHFPVSKIGIAGLSQGGHIAPIVATKSDEVAFLIDIVGSSLPMHELLVYEETYNLREIGFLPGISDLLARASAFYVRKFGQSDFWNTTDNFDPLPFWRSLNIPALVLYGADDTNVPSQRSADRLKALDKTNIKIVLFEGSGHALESPEGKGGSIFREDALRQIMDFIRSVLGPN
jgi:pimeloyl-ACP methyl ester carboxylesterase